MAPAGGRASGRAGGQATPAGLPPRSPQVARFMAWYFERFFRRHLNGLRLAPWGEPRAGAGPLVVYSNHPGWWDAAVYVLLGRRLFAGRACYAPIDAAMLAKYRVFARIGAFGIDLDGRKGAAAFLRTAEAILVRPGNVLWVTAQGRFVDARQRPLGLRAGIAHLAERVPDAVFLPLAIDYTFWNERGAEALVAFGRPLPAAGLLARPRPERLAALEEALTATMDRLAADALGRDPARFRTLVAGRAGIGGIYDGWRRLQAWRRGERFDPAHAAAPREPAA